jgi:hypothetical protein
MWSERGARRILAAALEAEVDAYLAGRAGRAGERDERGRRLVVRNGYAQPREVMTAAGAVQVRERCGLTTGASTSRRVSGGGSGR